MNLEYTRNRSRNYLALSIKETECVYYEAQMLKNNMLRSILNVTVRMLDECELLEYDVSGWQSIGDYFERKKLDTDAIKMLIDSLHSACEELERFLLSADGLVLEPKYVFIEPTLETVAFIYNAGDRLAFSENLHDFLKFILDHVDYHQNDATALAYGLYGLGSEEGVSSQTLLEYSKKEITPEEAKEEAVHEEEIPEEKRWSLLSLFGRKRKEKFREKLLSGSTQMLITQAPQEKCVTEDLTGQIGEQLVLEEITDEEEKDKFVVAAFPFVIGKQADDVDRCIEAPEISRIHARFVKDEEFYIEDMNSRNGTFINNRRLKIYERQAICEGDVISFASRRYQVIINPVR